MTLPTLLLLAALASSPTSIEELLGEELSEAETPTAAPAEAPAMPPQDFASPSSSAAPTWSEVAATVTVTGRLSGSSLNTRPVTLGLGYLYWAAPGALAVTLHHAPRLGGAPGEAEQGGLLMRPGARMGLTATGRLHRLLDFGAAPLTLGAVLALDASLDNAPTLEGATTSWVSLRGDAGVALHWWLHQDARRVAYVSLDVGPSFRRRTGAEARSWLGVTSTASLTFNRVSAFITLSQFPAGAGATPGLTGGHIYVGTALTGEVFPL